MKNADRPVRPALVGVGVGPGDPSLITVKAVRALKAADVVLVPTADTRMEQTGRAERIVLAACRGIEPRLHRVPFSMAERQGVGPKRRQAWSAATQAAEAAFADGAGTVAFATVGDPSLYSTFSYLAAHVRLVVPDLQVAVIPGITAMQALAANSLIPLAEGRESLTLVPATAGPKAFIDALDSSDTVVAYKGGRQLARLLELVREHRPRGTGVLGVNLGLSDEQLTPLDQVSADSVPYFSTVLVAPARSATGGRL